MFCGPTWPDLNASHVVVLRQRVTSIRRVMECPEINLLAGELRMPLHMSDECFTLSRVSTTDLVLGLSGDERSEVRNLLNLRRYPRIEMHFKFSDDARGDLVLEKGESGERIFRDAIEDWLQTTGEGRP